MLKNRFYQIPYTRQSLFVILLAMVVLLSFYKKSSYDIQEWDEARNGVNAFEMLQNHDFVNLYYDGQPDTWNAKPPLMIWLIAGSYSIFGFNEFALRLPTALATLIFFLLCFKTITLLDKPEVAFFTCLILMSSKAILGNHIGLTADFDGLLLVFLTASVYFFIRFCHFQQKNMVFFVALFTGLAFYTKGPASLTLLPGFLIYLLYKKHRWTFRCVQLWAAFTLFLLIAFSWLSISKKYGVTMADNSFYGSKNATETMLFYDTYQRFTNPAFDITGKQTNIYLFFFEVIDARLNLWNYVFYTGVLIGLVAWFKNKKNKTEFSETENNPMVTLSVCLILPLALVLTFASTKNNWYLAPTFMYIAYLITKTIFFLGKKNSAYYLLALALLFFTFTRQIFYLSNLSTERHQALGKNKDLQDKKILAVGSIQQDVLLYLKWNRAQIVTKPEDFSATGVSLFIQNLAAEMPVLTGKRTEILTRFEGYRIGHFRPQLTNASN